MSVRAHTCVCVCLCVYVSGCGLWASKPGCVALGPALCLSEALSISPFEKGEETLCFATGPEKVLEPLSAW